MLLHVSVLIVCIIVLQLLFKTFDSIIKMLTGKKLSVS